MRALLIFTMTLSLAFHAYAGSFAINEEKGKTITISYDDRAIAQLMIENDTSSPKAADRTYKVFLHVMNEDGSEPITKGAGSKYPHHRGIYIGWSKTRIDGRSYDTWHMKKGVRQHFKQIVEQSTSPDSAQLTVAIDWVDGEEILLTEKRTLFFSKPTATGAVMIDKTSEITAVKGDAELGGDREHAGCQFRAAAEVVQNKSAKYLFPQGEMSAKQVQQARDLPWAAMTFRVGEKSYHVQHMSHPSLPKPVEYSAYRDYGRFGSFFVTKIPKGESKAFRIRFYVSPGAFPESMVEDSQARYKAYAE